MIHINKRDDDQGRGKDEIPQGYQADAKLNHQQTGNRCGQQFDPEVADRKPGAAHPTPSASNKIGK